MGDGFPSHVTVNVVVSGKVTVEFVNTPFVWAPSPSAADLKAVSDLTATLTPGTAALSDAEKKNPAPAP